MAITDLAYIDAAGYHFADYPTFLKYYQDSYRRIYGADVSLDSSSQDGQWVAIEAQAAYDLAALAGSIYSSFSPTSAQGTGLSRVVKINGLIRRKSTNSTVDLTIVGQTATVITNGVAVDTLEQKWNLPAIVTIPVGGFVVVTATAQISGALLASANTVNRIFTPTLGWQQVNNSYAAIAGAAVETDGELRIRQAISTANPSLTVFEGTVGAIENTSGVLKVRGYENPTNTPDGNNLPPHSISMVVLGGSVADVAGQIQLHKTPGTATYGDVTQTVYDSHGVPIIINFFRPAPVTVKVTITLVVGVNWSNSFAPLIQAAVASTINSNKIGDTVLITKLFAPAYLSGLPAGLTFSIVTLLIGKNADPISTVNIPLGFKENAVCVAATDVTVIVT